MESGETALDAAVKQAVACEINETQSLLDRLLRSSTGASVSQVKANLLRECGAEATAR